MKPIIVTYSNESYILNMTKPLVLVGPGFIQSLPSDGYYYCECLLSHTKKLVTADEIKLIVRPKDKTPVTNY